jgi:hypothetical protein
MNISSIKQIVYQPKIFGIWSLFVLFHLVWHWRVDTEMNTAITYSAPAQAGERTQDPFVSFIYFLSLYRSATAALQTSFNTLIFQYATMFSIKHSQFLNHPKFIFCQWELLKLSGKVRENKRKKQNNTGFATQPGQTFKKFIFRYNHYSFLHDDKSDNQFGNFKSKS